MPEVYNWQLGRKMRYLYEEAHPKRQFACSSISTAASPARPAPMACKVDLDFLEGAGIHVVEQRGDQALRRVSAALGHEDPPAHRAGTRAARCGTAWDTSQKSDHAPYGVFNGMTIFDAGAKVGTGGDRLHPDGPRVAVAEHLRGYGLDRPIRATRLGMNPGSDAALPEHQTWFFYLQRICNHCTYPGCLAACPRKAIYKRPEDGIVLDRPEPLPRLQQVRGAVPVQEADVPGHHAHQ